MKKTLLKNILPAVLLPLLLINSYSAQVIEPSNSEEGETAAGFFSQPSTDSKKYIQLDEMKDEDILWTLKCLRVSDEERLNFVVDLNEFIKFENNTMKYSGIGRVTVSFKEKTELHKALKQILEPIGLAFYIDDVTEAERVYHINYKNNPDRKKRVIVKYPFKDNIFAEIKRLNSKYGTMNVSLSLNDRNIQVNDLPEVHEKIRALYQKKREAEKSVDEKDRGKIITKRYLLTYVLAGELNRQVKSVLSKEGTVGVDVKGNYLTVTDIAEAHPGVKNLILELDNPR